MLLDASFVAHPFPPGGRTDTRLPLSLSRFQSLGPGDYGGCDRCTRGALGVVQGRHVYVIRTWVGSEASTDDKRELDQLVRTLRFSRPHG